MGKSFRGKIVRYEIYFQPFSTRGISLVFSDKLRRNCEYYLIKAEEKGVYRLYRVRESKDKLRHSEPVLEIAK